MVVLFMLYGTGVGYNSLEYSLRDKMKINKKEETENGWGDKSLRTGEVYYIPSHQKGIHRSTDEDDSKQMKSLFLMFAIKL